MSRSLQFSLKGLLVDMGLLCLSLSALSWAHSIPVWTYRDDVAVIVVSGILAAISAMLLGRRLLRSWSLIVALIAAVPFLSYVWTTLFVR